MAGAWSCLVGEVVEGVVAHDDPREEEREDACHTRKALLLPYEAGGCSHREGRCSGSEEERMPERPSASGIAYDTYAVPTTSESSRCTACR